MPRVLIAEDDRVIANAMATHLRHAGMDVEWADRGDRAIRKIRFERPDVAVIDLMLPGMDGWRVIESLRADDVQIPVIVISARASEQDKVHALGDRRRRLPGQALRNERARGQGERGRPAGERASRRARRRAG